MSKSVDVWKVAVILATSLAARAAVCWISEYLLLDAYGIVDSTSSPSNWKEFLFSQGNNLQDQGRHIEPYPWLSRYAGFGAEASLLLLAHSRCFFVVTDTLLALCFGLSRVSTWSWKHWLHALCPVALLACMFESAASVQHLLLYMIVVICGSNNLRRTPLLLRMVLAAGFMVVIEPEFFAVPLMMLVDVVHDYPSRAAISNVCLIVAAAFATIGNSLYGPTRVPTRLQNLSPDSGPAWYLWQLLPPVFDRPYSTIMNWMPLLMTAPLVLRSSLLAKDALLPLVQERRYAVVCWSIGCAVVCRRTCSLLDLVFVLKLWAVFTPSVVAEMKHLFVPIVGSIMCVPLQRAFYRGWVTMHVANANWLFFTCVFQMAAFIMFQVSYVAAFIGRASIT